MGGEEQRSTENHSHKYVMVAISTEGNLDKSSIQMAIDLEGGRKGTQMVDFEKDTRRWWFSPRSWLWNSMRDSIASSTEPIWIRAILRSFLLNEENSEIVNILPTFVRVACHLLYCTWKTIFSL